MIAYKYRKEFQQTYNRATGNKILSRFIEISVRNITVRNILFKTVSESSLGICHSELFVIYSASFYETLTLI